MTLYVSLRSAIFSTPSFKFILTQILAGILKYGVCLVDMTLAKQMQMVYRYLSFIQNTIWQFTILFAGKKIKYKITWTYPISKHGHRFIISWRRIVSNACNVRVKLSTECDIDLSLVWGRFKLRVRKKSNLPGVYIPKQFHDNKLRQKKFAQT